MVSSGSPLKFDNTSDQYQWLIVTPPGFASEITDLCGAQMQEYGGLWLVDLQKRTLQASHSGGIETEASETPAMR